MFKNLTLNQKYFRKFTLAILLSILLLILFFLFLKDSANNQIDLTKNIIVSKAITNFENIINFRKWNAHYGGVYVKKVDGLEPNPYLKDNLILTDKNETLIKINPAWMTRQLSEIETIVDYNFRPISLKPLNPKNYPNEFEEKALNFLEKDRDKRYYYEFDIKNREFKFVGSLKVKSECLKCHSSYNIGDIRGGISIYLPIDEYIKDIESLSIRSTILLLIFFTLLTIIVILFYKFIKKTQIIDLQNEKLKLDINKKSKEVAVSKNYFETIFNAEDNIIIITDGEHLKDANSAFFNFFNYKNLEKFLSEHDCICDFFTKINDKRIIDKQIDGINWVNYILKHRNRDFKVFIDRDKKEHIFKLNVKPLTLDEQKRVLIVFSDISELENSRIILQNKVRREVEKSRERDRLMFQQTKYAQMGELISMIAHQWRQPLNTISVAAINLSIKQEFEELTKEYLNEQVDFIQFQTQKMSHTINDFMNFFKTDNKEEEFKLYEVLENIKDLIEPQLQDKNILFKYSCDKSIKLFTFKQELEHVLLNLVINSKDELVEKEKKDGFISVEVLEENNITILVKDNAGGIREDIIDRIFEPYFSTKEEGKGTGIGLFMSKSIIEKSLRGSIYVKNIENGACFYIVIPKD